MKRAEREGGGEEEGEGSRGDGMNRREGGAGVGEENRRMRRGGRLSVGDHLPFRG